MSCADLLCSQHSTDPGQTGAPETAAAVEDELRLKERSRWWLETTSKTAEDVAMTIARIEAVTVAGDGRRR
jgi:hypothetical protein